MVRRQRDGIEFGPADLDDAVVAAQGRTCGIAMGGTGNQYGVEIPQPFAAIDVDVAQVVRHVEQVSIALRRFAQPRMKGAMVEQDGGGGGPIRGLIGPESPPAVEATAQRVECRLRTLRLQRMVGDEIDAAAGGGATAGIHWRQDAR